MSTCSLQIKIQIDFQSVKVCTFSSLSFCWRGGGTSPVAHLVSLDVNVDVDSVSGGRSRATDDDMLAVPLQPDFDDEDIDE